MSPTTNTKIDKKHNTINIETKMNSSRCVIAMNT